MEENLKIERNGGVAGYEFFNRELHDPNDLPLLVWLRGDEPYFDSFTLDADQVMQELGIKRSRLTQISGKELRVGRKRDGRYVRPVYRPEDVAAYKEWSRAPATQARSSDLVNELMDRFENSIDDFTSARTEITTEFKEFLTPELLRTQREVFWKIESLERFHDERFDEVRRTMNQQINALLQSNAEVNASQAKEMRSEIAEAWKSSMEKLLQIELAQREMVDYHRIIVTQLNESLQTVQNYFTNLTSDVAHLKDELKQKEKELLVKKRAPSKTLIQKNQTSFAPPKITKRQRTKSFSH